MFIIHVLLSSIFFTVLSLCSVAYAISCQDNTHGEPILPFCKADMYFSCGKSGKSFSGILRLNTLGAGDSYDPSHVYLDAGPLNFIPQFWLTDTDGKKFFTTIKSEPYSLYRSYLVHKRVGKQFVPTGEIRKAGTVITQYPESAIRIPLSLRGSVPHPSWNSSIVKTGEIFPIGAGDLKKYDLEINYFYLHAMPESKRYNLYWVMGDGFADVNVRKISCVSAKVKK
jgi:hypothetical protein